MSLYFPTFYWVVRDFSLQLQDENGQSITSKDYLEFALALQNGNSENIKEKNKIRKHLTTFFKDRDCFTMIRPTIMENKLQELDKMDFEELRPEFVEQAMMLRKKITTAIKAKTLNHQKLNGETYCTMISSYVNAINAGQVPNLMDTWSLIRAEKSRRALDSVRLNYNEKLRGRIGSRLPMPSVRLSELLILMRR